MSHRVEGCSHSLEVVGELQVLVEQVAEVRDREGVHPVVIGWVSVTLLHHQAEPGGEESASDFSSREPSRLCPVPFLSLLQAP